MVHKINIAIVGATGAVGQMVLAILAERRFPIGQLHLVASERSVGKKIMFDQRELSVEDVAQFDFSKVQLAFFAAGSAVARHYAPIAVSAGCTVIDKSSYFRYQPQVSLVIPEVNGAVLKKLQLPSIIAVPNCSTIQMLVALKPIYDAVGIARINVCTYQAVSGTGVTGIAELKQQMEQWASDTSITKKVYPHPIAFNVLPHIDEFTENGYTKEEMKMVWETQKIFADDTIQVNPTTVRVPVFYGHSEAVHLETRKKITLAEAKELLGHAPGIQLCERDQDYPTPLTHTQHDDLVHVGRVRSDISHPNGLNMWIVGNNLRKGAALNAVQIAELLKF
jgi:aspartate-semialdehyde dehydrogenase